MEVKIAGAQLLRKRSDRGDLISILEKWQDLGNFVTGNDEAELEFCIGIL